MNRFPSGVERRMPALALLAFFLSRGARFVTLKGMVFGVSPECLRVPNCALWPSNLVMKLAEAAFNL
jgi:hypothetical protein